MVMSETFELIVESARRSKQLPQSRFRSKVFVQCLERSYMCYSYPIGTASDIYLKLLRSPSFGPHAYLSYKAISIQSLS